MIQDIAGRKPIKNRSGYHTYKKGMDTIEERSYYCLGGTYTVYWVGKCIQNPGNIQGGNLRNQEILKVLTGQN